MNDSSLKYEPNMNISTLSKRVLILFHILFSVPVRVRFPVGPAVNAPFGFASADCSVPLDAYWPE